MCRLYKLVSIVVCNVHDPFVRVHCVAEELPSVPVVFTDVQFDVPDVRHVPERVGVDERFDHVGLGVEQTLFADLEDDFAYLTVLVVGFEPEPDVVFGFPVRVFIALVKHGHSEHLFGQFVNFSLRCQAVRGHSGHPVVRCDQFSGFEEVEQVGDLAAVSLAVVDLAGCAHDTLAVRRGPVPTFTDGTRLLVECSVPGAEVAVFNGWFHAHLRAAGVDLAVRADGEEVRGWFVDYTGIRDGSLCAFVEGFEVVGHLVNQQYCVVVQNLVVARQVVVDLGAH